MGMRTGVESHISSSAAFVDGGNQDACDDTCCICLEAFSESDPSTVTSCKHEFHLHCVLEWCQRSSGCPLCWRAISLKDPASQELFETVETERRRRFKPVARDEHTAARQDYIFQFFAPEHRARTTTYYSATVLSPNASDFDVFDDEPDSEENISFPRPIAPSFRVTYVSTPLSLSPDATPTHPLVADSSSREGEPSSESQSISESLKSRLSSMSLRCKESISRTTRGWKEKLFPRSSSATASESNNRANGGNASST